MLKGLPPPNFTNVFADEDALPEGYLCSNLGRDIVPKGNRRSRIQKIAKFILFHALTHSRLLTTLLENNYLMLGSSSDHFCNMGIKSSAFGIERSCPCWCVEWSFLRPCLDLPFSPPVTVLQVHLSSPLFANHCSVEWVGMLVDWMTLVLWLLILNDVVLMDFVSFGSNLVPLSGFYIVSVRSLTVLEEKPNGVFLPVNTVLTGFDFPVGSCLDHSHLPIFPLVWSELDVQVLLVLQGSSSQLMHVSAFGAVYWSILWSDWRCLEALWSKRRWKLKMVQVQATTTRVEGTWDNSPARTELERGKRRGLKARGITHPRARSWRGGTTQVEGTRDP
ncbi:hypothetical protein F2Q69_00038121 [Brassica cretica]|uniref:Uncharacterized protein n=1 Tax=Brassica cretica TaxID=69181 RepID=A0A8S9SRN5_BRACR|nr:hypothetical protein F2Q69_00038121 [Brassica cretica]